MKRRWSLILVVAMLCASLPMAGQIRKGAGSTSESLDSSMLRNADEAIEEEISEGRIPGAVLAVVRQGKMVYEKAYGNRAVTPKKEPMTVNTVFDMASCTKPMATAISMMQLIESGKVRLLDPVSRFIPAFRSWRNGKDTVTIRIIHLLTHTSGLPSYGPVSELKEKYGSPNPEGLLDYISSCRRDFAPETHFQYSCLNYITMQHIIEKISGMSLRDYAQQHIFRPLGMRHTDFIPCRQNKKGFWISTDKPEWEKHSGNGQSYPIAPTERQSNGQILRGQVHDPLARVLNGGISGNAGLFSTAEDVATLCACLQAGGTLNGVRILSPQAVKAMRSVPRSLKQFGRTLGWDMYSPYNSNQGDLLSNETYSHTGYTGTSIVIDPVNDISIILLTNAVHPVDKYNVVRLRSIVANCVAAAIR